jgi:hypothetical protein
VNPAYSNEQLHSVYSNSLYFGPLHTAPCEAYSTLDGSEDCADVRAQLFGPYVQHCGVYVRSNIGGLVASSPAVATEFGFRFFPNAVDGGISSAPPRLEGAEATYLAARSGLRMHVPTASRQECREVINVSTSPLPSSAIDAHPYSKVCQWSFDAPSSTSTESITVALDINLHKGSVLKVVDPLGGLASQGHHEGATGVRWIVLEGTTALRLLWLRRVARRGDPAAGQCDHDPDHGVPPIQVTSYCGKMFMIHDVNDTSHHMSFAPTGAANWDEVPTSNVTGASTFIATTSYRAGIPSEICWDDRTAPPFPSSRLPRALRALLTTSLPIVQPSTCPP